MSYEKTNWQDLPSTATPINTTNLNKMENGIADANGAIGVDGYDSTATYAVGDLCMYNNTLYTCITTISTAEVWNSNHWQATSIFDYLERQLLLKDHPVGSYYLSSSPTNPSTLFGGTWTQIKDRFILAAGDTYSVGKTGGEATHTLTAAEMPSHFHYDVSSAIGDATLSSSNSIGTYSVAPNTDLPYSLRGTTSVPNSGKTSSAGSGKAHNNMPPYLVAYCWQRTG